ncbi:hypothetical protein OG883_36430 [Streptomyces sp. NBC_01142]|nr:hypothetical protein [Streptomyces sp. NBC_01142]MCX4825253.1 hypothetical protein [Streptomyces sp. NBC_01142]
MDAVLDDTGPSPFSRSSHTHDGPGGRLVDAAPVKVPMDTVGSRQ